jgi:N-acetyl sugar amidotransferase
MDTTDPEIVFDSDGVCNHCTNAIERLKQSPYGLPPKEKEAALNQLIEDVKKAGKGKQYDCIIGLSGGVDSSYVAYLVKKWGLRPLAIHLDNGWNLELAVKNIENICKVLDIDLYTDILDWEEFKDLQLAFLKASTPDSEIPTDNLIISSLYQAAAKHGIKYILTGYNTASESILARAWSQGHFDKTYITAVYKQFGTLRRKLSFHILSTWEMLVKRLCGTKLISTLDYITYNKEEAKIIMNEQFGWKDYGRKHGESNYTRIFQEYILPVKFGFDKRKAHFSSLIAAGQMTREEAIRRLSEPLYADEQSIQQDIDTLCRKFEITKNDFEKIMMLPVKSINNYKHMENTFKYRLYLIVRWFWHLIK